MSQRVVFSDINKFWMSLKSEGGNQHRIQGQPSGGRMSQDDIFNKTLIEILWNTNLPGLLQAAIPMKIGCI